MLDWILLAQAMTGSGPALELQPLLRRKHRITSNTGIRPA